MKALLLMIGIFLLLIVTFVIIWFATADRVGNEEAWLPESGMEYAKADGEAAYGQLFI